MQTHLGLCTDIDLHLDGIPTMESINRLADMVLRQTKALTPPSDVVHVVDMRCSLAPPSL